MTYERSPVQLRDYQNQSNTIKSTNHKPVNLLLACGLAVGALFTTKISCHAQALTPEEAKSIAEEAYIYGYPLVTMEMTRRVMTNVAEVKGTRGPMGHLIRVREYPTAAFKDVTAPNADTLYTQGAQGGNAQIELQPI
jgi:hypothetical protein